MVAAVQIRTVSTSSPFAKDPYMVSILKKLIQCEFDLKISMSIVILSP